MRTTLDVDKDLLETVMALTGEKSKSRAVNKALKEYAQRKSIDDLRAMAGTMDLGDSWRELRRLDLERQKKLQEMGW